MMYFTRPDEFLWTNQHTKHFDIKYSDINLSTGRKKMYIITAHAKNKHNYFSVKKEFKRRFPTAVIISYKMYYNYFDRL